jgi:CxxC motif-containing protein (DUF1111 family)
MRTPLFPLFLVAAAVAGACDDSGDVSRGDTASPATSTAADPLSGGTATAFDTTNGAYANQLPLLSDEHAVQFSLGHAVFNRNWVTAPATTESMDGLGPRFNQRSCSSCHSHDGRAAPFDHQGALLGMLFRLSVPGADEHGGPLGDPVYGGQLRPSALLGMPADGVPHVAYAETPGSYGDGTLFSLQTPTYTIDGWGYGEPQPGLMLSPRVGPSTIGLGLLEAIAEETLLAGVHHGDPDGVVGHPNHVWDASTGTKKIGRFGWKANVPLVVDQTAGAFNGDMGITSSIVPNETCTPTMTACLAAPSGGAPELSDEDLAAVSLYMRSLAVPARRKTGDATALHGAALFESFGCASCHTTTLRTGDYPELPEVAHQTIHPYTDLLLHDMGPGLADGRPDYEATGSEWRTAPLWGIGLLQAVNGHERLLHDGRARGMAEAILWHGGEAEASRERFRQAPAADRDALVIFLHSL